MTPPVVTPSLLTKFYNWLGKFPSLLVEIVGGLVLVGLLLLIYALLSPLYALLILATGCSVLYELKLDPNKWSWKDVSEREIGIILGVIIWKILQ